MRTFNLIVKFILMSRTVTYMLVQYSNCNDHYMKN